MKKQLTILTLITSLCCNIAKADEDYALSKVPEALLTGANAVMRDTKTEISIVSASEIYVTTHYAVTVLNEEGSHFAAVREEYDRFSKIESIEGWLYNKDSKLETHIPKKSQKEDYGMFDNSFFSDYRYKYCEFKYKLYPYTVVFDIVKKYTNSYFLPRWLPQEFSEYSVVKAAVEVDYPRSLKLKYLPVRLNKQPVITPQGDRSVLKLEMNDLPAIPPADEFTPATKLYPPMLVLTTEQMELDGVKGNMTSWKEYGSLFYRLNENRDELPDQLKKTIHLLTDTCTSQYSKISILYSYMQANTRYVLILLGIGGLQTLEASFVAEKGYGDCKALSNFTKAILKEAGITSYQALVYGGNKEKSRIVPEYAYHTSNHVILCVPQPKDSIWLECTSKDLCAGYLSSFTGNRTALLLTPDGGYIVNTPAYNSEHNILARNATFIVDEKDEIKGNVHAYYSGSWWDMESHVKQDPKSKTDDYFNKKFSIPSYKAGDYKIASDKKNMIPVLTEEIPVAGSGVATRSGNRLFFSPQVLNLSIPSAEAIDSRTDSFEVFKDYQVNDTTTFTFKDSYKAEKLANDINYEFPFGSYHSKSFFENGNTLKIVVSYHQKSGIYPPVAFADYKKLSKAINMGSAYNKVVLSK